MSKRVYPSEPTLAMWSNSSELQKRWSTSQASRPYDEYEALMRAAPHDEPEESSKERHDKYELVAQAVNALPEEHRIVIEHLFWEDRGSLRKAGKIIGRDKNAVARIRDEALDYLSTDPYIILTIIDQLTWENSSHD